MKIPGVRLPLALILASFPGVSPVMAQPVQSELEISVLVDEKEIPESNGFALPLESRDVRIWVRGKMNGKPADVGRVRFKMEGLDKKWWELGSDMGLRVRFTSDAKTPFPLNSFPVVSVSSGWDRDIAHSSLTHRREVLTVPADAGYIGVTISSAGPPTAMGIYLVANLILKVETAEGGISQTALLPFGPGDRDLGRDAAVEGWSRQGTAPAMAKVLKTGGKDPTYALGVIDNITNGHADWLSEERRIPQPTAAMRFVLEWDEAYSIGFGLVSRADYKTIPPGSYTFRVNKLDTIGNPLEYETSVRLTVAAPFWKNPWLWVVVANVVLLLGIYFSRRIARRREEKLIENLRQQYVLESERLRIARNIHDDLGARLTHVILASGMAADESATLSEAKTGLHEISNMTKDLVSALRETVWAVDPKNDSLQSLIDFLCDGTQKLCDSANIRCELDVCEIETNIQLSSEFRHHVSLAVKEAVNNAVKYSQSEAITLKIVEEKKHLMIEVRDFGVSMSKDQGEGHGLENMRFRIEAVGGQFEIRSDAGKGTLVRIEVPLPS